MMAMMAMMASQNPTQDLFSLPTEEWLFLSPPLKLQRNGKKGGFKNPFLFVFLRKDWQQRSVSRFSPRILVAPGSLAPQTLPCQIATIQSDRDQMPVSTGFAESFLITWMSSIFQCQINSRNVPVMAIDHCAQMVKSVSGGWGQMLRPVLSNCYPISEPRFKLVFKKKY